MSAMRMPDYGRRPADPPRQPDALESYRGRGEVTPAGRALLRLVERLSARQGFCYASNDYLARELRLSARHVQRLKVELRGAGYLAVTYRRAQTALLRVRKRPQESDGGGGEAGAGEGGGGDTRVTPGVTSASSPGATCASPNELKNILIGGQADGPGQGTLPFGGQRLYFNPRRPWNGHERWHPLQRLKYGFEQGRFLFTAVGGVPRTVCSVDWTHTHARVGLLDETGPDRAPVHVTVRADELGDWLFWR